MIWEYSSNVILFYCDFQKDPQRHLPNAHTLPPIHPNAVITSEPRNAAPPLRKSRRKRLPLEFKYITPLLAPTYCGRLKCGDRTRCTLVLRVWCRQDGTQGWRQGPLEQDAHPEAAGARQHHRQRGGSEQKVRGVVRWGFGFSCGWAFWCWLCV